MSQCFLVMPSIRVFTVYEKKRLPIEFYHKVWKFTF